MESMKTLNVNLFGWAETNPYWINYNTQMEYREKTLTKFEVTKSVFSTSEIPSISNYKPGGTAITMTGKWCDRASPETGQDPSGMGRWSFSTLKGRNSMEIVFIIAYRVSEVSMPQHGNGITYHQEHMMLSKKDHPSPNPRAQFIADMIQFIQSHQSKGWEILLMINANEAVGDSSQGIASVMCACALYNIMQATHPEIELPVTYNRSTKTINHILGSQHCLNSTKCAGILPFYNNIQADHRALYINMDAMLLFGGNQSNITTAKKGLLSHQMRTTAGSI